MTAVAVIVPAVLLVLQMTSSSAGQKIITAVPGQDVTLPRRAPNGNNTGVKWSRADLEREYVYAKRDGRVEPDNQHRSFKNRVELKDSQMKDGDASLILENVTVNDTGTYECRVLMRRTNRNNNDPISIIYLRVAPPGPTGGTKEDGGKEDGGKKDGGKEDGGQEDGSGHLRVDPVAFVVLPLLVSVVSVVIYIKQKKEEFIPPSTC